MSTNPDVPKRALIALADCIIEHNRCAANTPFTSDQLKTITSFCRRANQAFDCERFLNYVAGTRTANGAIPYELRLPKNMGKYPLSPGKEMVRRLKGGE